MPDKLKFKNRWYTFAEEVVTQISTEYVPDWELYNALRESTQNAVDERTLSGCNVYRGWDGDTVWIQDNGRGVEFDDICFIGISGKRGETGVVGQHGEGEMVSFLVAARNGVKKTMASKNWLAIGKVVEVRGHDVLALDVYRSEKPRKGTVWIYKGSYDLQDAMERAWDSFVQTRGGRRKRIHRYSAGQLWTCGMKVNKLEDLSLGYDLDITPGRDRGGFTWDQAKDEIARILEKYANASHISAILTFLARSYYDPKEGYLELDLDSKLVKMAGRLASGSSSKKAVSWCVRGGLGDGPAMSDALDQGLTVLQFNQPPPRWITDNFPNVQRVVGAKKQVKAKALPAHVQKVVDLVRPLFGEYLYDEVTFEAVWKFDDELSGTVASANQAAKVITLSRAYLKKVDFQQFIEILAHEIAHIVSGAPDCTRAHADAIERVLGTVMQRVVKSEKQRARYLEAEKLFGEYTK